MDLIFSDIHADIDSLKKIISIVTSKDFEKNYGKISSIVNLGDVLERGSNPKEVLQMLKILSKKYTLISIIGNHDEAFLLNKKISINSPESIEAHSLLTNDDLSFFSMNKDGTFGQREYVDKKRRMVFVHGGPINPDTITMTSDMDAWRCQKSWQRLSDENLNFYSPVGYFYSANSAFAEVSRYLKNFILFCGHTHNESVKKQNKNGIFDILNSLQTKKENFNDFVLYKKEFLIEENTNYIVKVGIAGSKSDGENNNMSHFVICDYPYRIILFQIKNY